VLFVFKIEGIFGKEKVSPKVLKEVVFFIYSIDETDNNIIKFNPNYNKNKLKIY